MTDGLVRILDGNTFVVSDRRGDIEASATDPAGLFAWDTRFPLALGAHRGRPTVDPLSTDDLKLLRDAVLPRPGHGHRLRQRESHRHPPAGGRRRFTESIILLNHQEKAVDLVVRVDVGCDFADLFEVKDALGKQGTYGTLWRTGR